MKMLVRAAAAFSMFAALVGVSTLVTAKGGPPPPPPPDLCACSCPDGSVVVAHTPTGDCETGCPIIVANFCASDM